MTKSTLSWTIEVVGDVTRIRMVGEITEASDFLSLLDGLPERGVIDLEGVRRINSAGAREWVNFTEGLQKRGRSVTLDRCSVAFVHQMNLISNFRGHSKVLSCLAPYFCGKCNKEHPITIDLSTGSAPVLADALACPDCGSQMEFDDLPEHYLSFMD